MSSSSRTAMLLDEARGLSGDFDKLSQAVAEAVGMSPVELLAMDVVSREGTATAGRLAEELSLTTGAITGLIDRLERAGFARRKADPTDRRRVLVTRTAKERQLRELYAPLAARLRRAVAGYSDAEMATLIEFLQKLRAAMAVSVSEIRHDASSPSQATSPRAGRKQRSAPGSRPRRITGP